MQHKSPTTPAPAESRKNTPFTPNKLSCSAPVRNKSQFNLRPINNLLFSVLSASLINHFVCCPAPPAPPDLIWPTTPPRKHINNLSLRFTRTPSHSATPHPSAVHTEQQHHQSTCMRWTMTRKIHNRQGMSGELSENIRPSLPRLTQSGISMLTIGTTGLNSSSFLFCSDRLRLSWHFSISTLSRSLAVSPESRSLLSPLPVSEEWYEMLPNSCRQGRAVSRKMEKFLRIPNHPEEGKGTEEGEEG